MDTTGVSSNARQQYDQECEEGVITQLHLAVSSVNIYTSIANYCGRHDVALPGLERYFLSAADRKRAAVDKVTVQIWPLH